MSQRLPNLIVPNFQTTPFDSQLYSPDDIVLLSPTHLSFKNKVYRCATGKGGIRENKQEGDGATPVGSFPLRQLFYRPDRLDPSIIDLISHTGLPSSPLTMVDGWCDDPISRHYNQQIILPSKDHHERLWREENVYDLIIPFGYNDAPIVPNKGSAIFMHLARPDYSPTEGCLALSLEDFLDILMKIA